MFKVVNDKFGVNGVALVVKLKNETGMGFDQLVFNGPHDLNRYLAAEGKIERFSHVRPGTGKRGRPGKDQINELPEGDVLFVDEITGIAYQGRATLSRSEVSEHVFETFARGLRVVSDPDYGIPGVPVVEADADDVAAIEAFG